MRDGLPLIGYTDAGLEKAKAYVMEPWLTELRTQREALAAGESLTGSFRFSVCSRRNRDRMFLVIDRLGSEADVRWLPLLQAWSAVEMRRVRGCLQPMIDWLRRNASDEASREPQAREDTGCIAWP